MDIYWGLAILLAFYLLLIGMSYLKGKLSSNHFS
jgi:hypothetical protein